MPSAIFSAAEAVQLGQFVLNAYTLFSSSATFALPAGYTLVTELFADDITDNSPDYFSFGFIAKSGSDVVVAIRGTEGVLEWIRDFEFTPVRFPYVAAGETETGFTDFYATLRTGKSNTTPRAIEAIAALVAGGAVTTLRIAGHSLGAALVTMLAIDVAGNGVFAKPVVYTFGSPRVGDKVFSGTYDTLIETSWRVANLNDIVTQLPPQFVGYTHVDADQPINSDDRSRHNFRCWHALDTYLNILDPTVALDAPCVP